ncbi:peptide ABC transporter substrate-binding protein [Ruminiclostridium cellulolyticum]|uniref:Extracellular solute-binding protein family 5 n=1 Tax=Ruminiclostridium cellulolyticum (strain ATCC 35319 / DSM 5812 / JCM 6584 / H10) TaxID=394503 RepID=B8I765_RUMCH|nr:peptide ABC transporter substrate-binding protein [Ruminiclostridium cellulolyticum]ACL74989.1 extracellular solute-binding protein family 5 [Ruminiclostridium cellulolyticum H10]
MMTKALRLISLFIITGLMLSACSVNLNKKSANQDEDIYEGKYDILDKGPEKGGSIRLFSTPVDTLNPILTNNQYVQDFLGFVFEGLYRLDEKQQPVPVLAERAVTSADGLKLTVTLKKGIKWHNGLPLQAGDVVFTINSIMDTKNSSVYAANLQNIASVTAGNNNSVVITLKKPDSMLLYSLTFPVISMQYFNKEKLSDKNSKKNLSPVGTGPYTFVSYNAKNGVKFKANDDWWNKGNSEVTTPYIQSLEIKIFENAGKATKVFQSRDVDVVTVDHSEFKKYINRTDISLKRYPGKNYEFLSLNVTKGPMANKNLRSALGGFIDKKKLIDTAVQGIAIPAELPLFPNSWINQLVNMEQYSDLKKAKQLMTQSGYVLSKNKYVSKANSRALSLKLIVNQDNTLRVNTADAIASQLVKNGINVEVEKLTWENVQKRIKSGAYDMALLGYQISTKPDLSFAYSTDSIESGLNTAKYSNPAVDGYLQQILTQSDIEKQKSLYTKLLNTVLDERPYIGLYFISQGIMCSKNIKGAINPNVWNSYNDISQWYVPQ